MKDKVLHLFEDIVENLRERDKATLNQMVVDAYDLDQLRVYMDSRLIVRVNWCGDPDCAFRIKDEVSGEVRGTPWEKDAQPSGPCIMCGDEAKYVAFVSRTY